MAPFAPMVAETGNGFIDITHAALLRHIGDIREQCADGAPREAVVPSFDAFVGEMTVHFGHEELILRAVGYDHWEEHAEQHRALGRQIGRLVDYLRECDVSHDFLCTVAGTLDAALNQHEIKHDGAYASLLRTQFAPPPEGELITWAIGFETGVEPIDAQHRELAELVNELHRLAGGVHAKADALALLERMHLHVRAHFEVEERLLRAASPTRCLSHAASHKLMESQFLAVRDQVVADVVDLEVAVRDFLRFWLMDHILVCDRPHFLLMGLGRPMEYMA
ncbi:MAG TPA: hemerythrin domain-containing protein [Azospirillum sp.]|nr:hemerythrin domain-containing protein [Azospirillum sp.]